MKQLIIYSILISNCLLQNGCSVKKEDVVGAYIAKNNVHTNDTLKIFQDGTYNQKIYRKGDNSLVFENSNTWKYDDKRITFQDFFPDDDKVYNVEASDFETLLITSSFTVEKKSDKVSINYQEDKGAFHYEKQ